MTHTLPIRSLPDSVVSDVYGEKFGWRMFDSSFLTPAIADFLAAEKPAIAALLVARPHIRTVVEVGCGYGRFAPLVADYGRDYIGLDLISWLVELGTSANPASAATTHRDFIATSVLNLGHVLDAKGFSGVDRANTAVFLPFNCLGNITYLDDILRQLSALGVDIIASLFDTSVSATAARQVYYARCGLSAITTELNNEGTTVTSAEGFDSIGFDTAHIRARMAAHGYRTDEVHTLAGIGHMTYFTAGKKSGGTRRASGPMPQGRYHPPIAMYQLELAPGRSISAVYWLDTSASATSPTGLLAFECVRIAKSADWKAAVSYLSHVHDCPVCVLELVTDKDTVFLPVRTR